MFYLNSFIPTNNLFPILIKQLLYIRYRDQRRSNRNIGIHIHSMTAMLLLIILLLLNSIEHSIGFRHVNDQTENRQQHQQQQQSSRKVFDDLINVFQATHPSSSSSHSQQHQRYRRFSIWNRPSTTANVSTSLFRGRLANIGRPFRAIQARQWNSPDTYNRLTQFVRHRLHDISVTMGDKLRQHGRSLDGRIKQLQSSASIINQTTTTATATTATATTTTAAAINETINERSNNNNSSNLSRRADDTTWANQIDNEQMFNSSGKSMENNPQYKSPTLNVIDLDPDKTKIAHNILVVRKTAPSNGNGNVNNDKHRHDQLITKHLPTPAPVLVSSHIKTFNTNAQTTIRVWTTPRTPTDDEILEFKPFRNNHRPSAFMSLAMWKLKNKDKITSTNGFRPTTTPTTTTMTTSTTTTTTSFPFITKYRPSTLFGLTRVTERGTSTTRPKPSSTTTTTSTTQSPSSTRRVIIQNTRPLNGVNRSTTTTTIGTSTTTTTTTKAPSSSVSNEEDPWSTFVTDNPTTPTPSSSSSSGNIITIGGNIGEFDLPITRRPASTNANESTQSLQTPTLQQQHQQQRPTTNGSNNNTGVQLANTMQTTWSEVITSKPIDAMLNGDRITTITETGPLTSTVPTNSKEDDNSIELMKEYNQQHHHHNHHHQHQPQPQQQPKPVIGQSNVVNKVNFYVDNVQKNGNSDHNSLKDDGIVIFKNNHGRPRRPLSTIRPNMGKYGITVRPPYVTDFYHPTTLSVRKPAITVANIVSHRVKQPDDISASLTVLDPPFVPNSFMQLPLNTTIVHKNLLVPMKEGRPKPTFPSRPTTHFPVYPVVAGITNWQSQTTPWLLPAMTTSAPEDLFPLASNDEFKLHSTTSTPSPPKTIHQVIAVLAPGQPIPFDHSINKYKGTTSTKTSTTTTTTTSTTTTTPAPSTSAPSPPRPPSYPVATSAGYVNAIYAPPMPMIRPSQVLEAQSQTIVNWLKPLNKLVDMITPSTYGAVSFLSLVKSALYTLMVMLLPPIALVTAFTFV